VSSGPGLAPGDRALRAFTPRYRDARAGFVADAEAAGLELHSLTHPLRGADGEALALDVARAGAADARALLIVSSGCHGVEGACGSGLQRALINDGGFHRAAAAAGVAVLYLHALNPWGFSWWRRTTHENVDLNRNFHDFHAPLPGNPGHDALAAWIVPREWPSPEADTKLAAYAADHGPRALQTAVSAGQYTHPEGLFYGGRAPTWSQQAVRQVLREQAGRCERLGWIDLHTGLGPSGVGERIFACRDDAAALARARAWWGDGITSIYDGSSTSALLSGLMWNAVYQECPQAEYTGIALEYGTVPLDEVIGALRADQWLENHPEAGADRRAAIKQRTLAAFYVDTDEWKSAVLAQGLQAAYQAVRGLAG
jgi:hypothetical protein